MVQARVRDALDRRLRWLFGTAAATFGFLGGAVLLGMLGVPVPAFLAALEPPAVPWAPFVVAYAATAGLLAARIARRPRDETFSMLVLAAGLAVSGASSLASLLVLEAPGPSSAGGVATGAGIDFAVALVFAAAWVRLWLAAVPGTVRQQRDEALLVALLDLLVPSGGAGEIGATDPDVRGAILTRRSASASEASLRLGLRGIDLVSRVLVRKPFARASTDERGEVLERLCGSRVSWARQEALAWRDAALTSYYADARVLARVGFDQAYLEHRLVEGPNREEHRRRLVETEPQAEPDSLRRPTSEPRAPALRLIRSGGPSSA